MFLSLIVLLLGERVYAHQMVRTDSREQKLDAFLAPRSLGSHIEPHTSSSSNTNVGTSTSEEERQGGERKRSAGEKLEPPATRRRRHHKPVQLTSVKNLQRHVLNKEHRGNLDIKNNIVSMYPFANKWYPYSTILRRSDISLP